MGVELFNTFGGNPVSAAAGLEVLNVIESEALDHNAVVVGGYLKDEFEKLKHKLDIIGDIRGSGLFLGIELVRDHFTLEPATNETSVLCTTLKEKYRILTSIDGPHNNVLVLKPPMVFSKENVDELISCFESAVTNDLCDVDCDQAPSKTPT
jgi:4-aminobutyrate aminotransferase-like enzyme